MAIQGNELKPLTRDQLTAAHRKVGRLTKDIAADPTTHDVYTTNDEDTSVTTITEKVRNRMRSRAGNGDPSALANGIASAAASETIGRAQTSTAAWNASWEPGTPAKPES